MRSAGSHRALLLLAATALLSTGCSATVGDNQPNQSPSVLVVPTTDGPGVDDDTIYLAALAVGADAPATGEVDEEKTAMVQAMGLPWPGDRDVKVIAVNIGEAEPGPDETAQLVCDKLRSLDKPVLGFLTNSQPQPISDCLEGQGVMIVANNVQLRQDQLAPNTLTITTTAPADLVPPAVISDLDKRGWFGDGATTAVLTDSEPLDPRLADLESRLLVKALKAAGSQGNKILAIDPENADELSSTVLKMKSEGVDHVLCWACYRPVLFTTAATAQNFDPSLAIWDGPFAGAPFYDLSTSGWGPTMKKTFVGYSAHPNYTLPQITDVLRNDRLISRCLSAADDDLSLDSGGIAANVCLGPALISAGLAAAPRGSGVNAAAAIAGLQSIKDDDALTWADYGRLLYGPQRGAGANELFVSKLNPECGCLLTSDKTVALS